MLADIACPCITQIQAGWLLIDGGPVGVETMAAALSEQRDTIEEVIEPYLIQQGLLVRTQRGRALTSHSYSHLGIKAPLSVTQLELMEETPDE